MGEMPAPVITGSAIEPTMMTPPRPLSPRKTKAVVAVSRKAIAIGRSPANSAAFLTIASDIPVFCTTRANIAPNTTSTIGAASRNEPESSTSFSQPAKEIPDTPATHAAINGSAKSVGKRRSAISAAKIMNPLKRHTPESVIPCTS